MKPGIAQRGGRKVQKANVFGPHAFVPHPAAHGLWLRTDTCVLKVRCSYCGSGLGIPCNDRRAGTAGKRLGFPAHDRLIIEVRS